ncbi:MAG TPA: threonylcarbamoyl-AMP synthase [Dehalococcoidia bacterium]|nr:threonylcarbamoyl-AMP synthase [Dehalococcoidia bacterium]
MLLSPDAAGLDDAANAINNGALVAFPTDTFFALGANGLDSLAVENVFSTKGRNPGTPVPLLISQINMVEKLASEFPNVLGRLAEEFWPGALTLVVQATDSVPTVVTGGTGTVGLRIPDHHVARSLIDLAGTPLTGTSCNLTGRDPIKDATVVEQVFGDHITACINGPCGVSTAPSTVVSYENNEINVLRLGAISLESIRNTVGDIVIS